MWSSGWEWVGDVNRLGGVRKCDKSKVPNEYRVRGV